MKIIRIIIAALTIIFMVDLLVFASVVFSDREYDKSEPQEVIRIGVATDKDRVETDKTLQAFFNVLHDQGKYELKPCFCNSYPEAIAGFIHGSLDLILINPAYYLHLKRKYNARIVAVQKFSEEEKTYNHAVLLSNKQFRHINTTRDMRITFSNRYSMNGYIIPFRHLECNLPKPPDQWFSKISFSNSFEQSLDDLANNRTDIVAIDLNWLKNHEKYRDAAEKFHTIWTSQVMPESVICVSFASAYFNAPVLQDITSKLWDAAQNDTVFNRNSMLFEPLNYDYEMELNKLERFLYGDKK